MLNDPPVVSIENYSAMTVNERLVVSGLLEDFDKAAFAMNDAEMDRILEMVALPKEGRDAVIDWVHNSPQSMYRRRNG